jgi:PAS domain S-box-containing protein
MLGFSGRFTGQVHRYNVENPYGDIWPGADVGKRSQMAKQKQILIDQESAAGFATALAPRAAGGMAECAVAQDDAGGYRPIAGTVQDTGHSLAARLTLLTTVPAVLAAGLFAVLAAQGAGAPVAIIGAAVLLALGAAFAIRQARSILVPVQKITERCDQLALHFSAEPRGTSRTEMGALVGAFDAMGAAMLKSMAVTRESAREEAQTSLHLQRQYALMQMLRNLASMANNGESLERSLQNSLREIGSYLDWPLGRLLLMTRVHGHADRSESRSHWYAPDPARFSRFIGGADDGALESGSSGLIGRARQSNLSHWVSDLARLEDWHQREAAIACGLRTGFIIPIAVSAEVMAFIEFFSDHRIEAGDELLELIEAISVELWRTANRYQSEAALRATGTRARRLASIAEAMEGAIAVTGANGRVEWVNAGMTRLIGHTATQSIGRDVPTLLFSSDPDSAAECQRQIEAGARTRGLVLPAHNESGEPRWYEMEIQGMPDRGDGAAGCFVLVRDITQERNTQGALSAALEDARQASQSKSQFLANMSHEIRTPMNGVLGMAELLLGTELDDRQRRFIESLYRSGESLLDIINDILDFSKIEAGKLELECIDFDLRTLIEDLIELLAPRAHQKRIELAYKLSPGLPATVRGDPTRLRQVLINIIGNAIKFTERGEVVLTVEPLAGDTAPASAAADAPATLVRFVIRDTGIGMRTESVERLFSVFMQADQSSSRRYGGTGLGLAICRQLTELMGGGISATSHIGEGSVFQVELPLRHGDSTAVAARPVPAASIAGKRVLIAEDNPTNRRILHEQLRALEMDCALAENGRQALQMLRIAARSASPFDVAVVDMKMPIMDGMALSEQVRADAALAGVRLVMLTSITGRDEARRAQAIGVDAYLAKPVRQQELIATLSMVLGSAPAELAPQKATSRLTGLAGRRILVVEDNPVNQEVVTAMLAAFGCEASLAEDGLVALGLLEREDFDVVLMDCQMPTMDGFEAMRRLRDPAYRQHDLTRARRTPVIALTANALSGDAERCRVAGFSDYLAKPFRQQDLGEILLLWAQARDLGVAGGSASALAPARLALLPAPLPVVDGAAHPAPAAGAAAVDAILDERVLKDILAMERNGARDLLRRLVTTYAQSSAALLDAAEQAFARQDPAAVAQALHTLKSSSANLGAVHFSRACGQIEALARQSNLAPAEPIWRDVRAGYGDVVAALHALRPGTGGAVAGGANDGSRAAAVER